MDAREIRGVLGDSIVYGGVIAGYVVGVPYMVIEDGWVNAATNLGMVVSCPFWVPVLGIGGSAFSLLLGGMSHTNPQYLRLGSIYAVTLLIVCTGLWKRGIRRARIRLGLCTHCGYDLRESGERCPECGAVTKKIRHRDSV